MMVTTESVFYCVFSALVIATNLHLIFTILSKWTLRRNSKYILVLTLAFIDLYVGVFELPVYTNILLTASAPSCGVSIVIQASPYFYTMMGCLAITAIHLDFNFRNSKTNYIDRTRRVITGVLVAFVVVVPFIILVPIFISGRSQLPVGLYTCALTMSKTFTKAANVVTYWVPVVCMLFTSTIVVIKYRNSKRPLYGNQQFPTNYQHTSNQVGGRQYPESTHMQNPGSHMYQFPPNNQQLVGIGQHQQITENQHPDGRMYQGNQLPPNSQQLVGIGQHQQITENQHPDGRMYQGNQLPPNSQQLVGIGQHQQITENQHPDGRMYQGNQLPPNSQQFVSAPQYSGSHQYPGSPPQQAPIMVQDPNNPSDLIVAAVVTIVLLLPGQVISMVMMNCQDLNCFSDFVVSLQLVQFLGYSKSFLLPVIWYINKGFRDARRGVQGVPVSHNNGATELPPPYYAEQQGTDAPPYGVEQGTNATPPYGVEHQQTKY